MTIRSSSPDGRHWVERRYGGELWMSGPEWEFISIDGGPELTCLPSNVAWSDDSEFVAFVELHMDNVPNRMSDQGITSRVVVVRLRDGARRQFLGNRRLARVELVGFSGGTLSVRVNGAPRELRITEANW